VSEAQSRKRRHTAIHDTSDEADELSLHALRCVSERNTRHCAKLTIAAVRMDTLRCASFRTSEKRSNGSRNWFAWGPQMKRIGPSRGMLKAPRGLRRGQPAGHDACGDAGLQSSCYQTTPTLT
jgi:hypothetical protein